ncbi:SDR family oxidoreductase [bacterium]|nr:SDR family oxidoreductase [bacterium]
MIKYSFTGRVVLVTASSQGIGYGIAKAFLEAGAKVVINGRDQAKLKVALEKLKLIDKSRICSLAGDISNSNFIESLVSHTEKKFSSNIDILINNSGGPQVGPALSFSDNDWSAAIENNLLSVIRLTKLVTENMIKKKWGRIINLTSLLGKEPANNMILSNVTRAAVAAYSKSVSNEIAKFGITVNNILTGGCLTERFYGLVNKQIEGTSETLENAIARMSKQSVVERIATPEEFAQTILYLASEESSYLTGVSIALDGGNSKSIF